MHIEVGPITRDTYTSQRVQERRNTRAIFSCPRKSIYTRVIYPLVASTRAPASSEVQPRRHADNHRDNSLSLGRSFVSLFEGTDSYSLLYRRDARGCCLVSSEATYTLTNARYGKARAPLDIPMPMHLQRVIVIAKHGFASNRSTVTIPWRQPVLARVLFIHRSSNFGPLSHSAFILDRFSE